MFVVTLLHLGALDGLQGVKIQPVLPIIQFSRFDARLQVRLASFCLIKSEQEFHVEQSSEFIKSSSTILTLWHTTSNK